jgi:hypothetical protein
MAHSNRCAHSSEKPQATTQARNFQRVKDRSLDAPVNVAAARRALNAFDESDDSLSPEAGCRRVDGAVSGAPSAPR